MLVKNLKVIKRLFKELFLLKYIFMKNNNYNLILFSVLTIPLFFVSFITLFMDSHITKNEMIEELNNSKWVSTEGASANIIIKKDKYIINFNKYCNIKLEGEIFNLDYKKYDTKLLYLESISKCNNLDVPPIILHLEKFNENQIVLKKLSDEDLKYIISNVYFEDKELKEKFLIVYHTFKIYNSEKKYNFRSYLFNKMKY